MICVGIEQLRNKSTRFKHTSVFANSFDVMTTFTTTFTGPSLEILSFLLHFLVEKFTNVFSSEKSSATPVFCVEHIDAKPPAASNLFHFDLLKWSQYHVN